MSARRNVLINMQPDSSIHPGLLLDRYLEQQNDEKAKLKLVADVCNCKQSDFYKMALRRWRDQVTGSETIAVKESLTVRGRLVTGLGIANPIEAGISLHHTYGMPWLPGSGLKGLASHFCHIVWGAQDKEYQRGGAHHTLMFGTTDSSGILLFHDGWWSGGNGPFMKDVLTPHHQDYYSGKDVLATDFDMPVPVPFVSIVGNFDVAVECVASDNNDRGKQWAELGLQLLCEALSEWGFGGKTNAGYGRVSGDNNQQNGAAERNIQANRDALETFRQWFVETGRNLPINMHNQIVTRLQKLQGNVDQHREACGIVKQHIRERDRSRQLTSYLDNYN